MAETILITTAINPLVSMLLQKASSSLLGQYNVMTGMEEKREILKRKLKAILSVIDDAEMQAAEHRQEGRKLWLEAVRNMAYKGNDIFDELKYEALRRKAKEEGHYRELGMDVIKLFPTHNRFVFRIKMGKKLSMILQKIDNLIGEMIAFNFQSQPQQQLPIERKLTDSDIIDPMEIASKSRAGEKEMIVDTLLGQKNNVNLTVLSIFGMGGLGKTTLSQLVYNDSRIRDHFQLLVWVCVSNNFDVDFVATSIVKAITNKHVTVGKSPCHSLEEAVSGKRYLLVLDDVWNRDIQKWDTLKFYLGKGCMGSWILTTTRDESIARFMGGKTEPHKLGLLDKRFIEKIIKAKAFLSEASSPANELVVMVGDMADKCVGSPLAASALGSVLRTKTSKDEWNAILSRTTICDNETDILSILWLSYSVLPSEMRQCFSFCAMFPKGYEIDREMLIQLWIANGFILKKQGVCPEIKGEQIFNELACRSFFHDVKKIPFDTFHYNMFGYCSRITCKIHDLMRDVAHSSAIGKECATIAAQSSNSSNDIPYSARHLYVPLEYPKTVLNGFLAKSFPGLQTLLFTRGDTKKELQYLTKCNSIRALVIRDGPLISREATLWQFVKPKYLHHLRYLDLSGSHIMIFPEDISILYHLQTLNLSGCRSLVELPKGMKYMIALRHLYTHGCSHLKMMPPGLRCLTSLRTLTYFIVGTPGPSCGGIAELGPLLDLGGRLEVHKLENVTETSVQAAKIGNKKRLTELILYWSDPNNDLQQHDHNKVLEGMKPHDEIKVLRLYSYGGSTCPAWMNTLNDMVELVLSGCKNIENLPQLWQLSALRLLEMSGMENVQFFCGGGDPPFTFKKMKSLRLVGMSNLETWWPRDINEVQGQEPMFPELEKLIIEDCKKLMTLPRASSWVVNATVRRSACPALKKLELKNLTAFERWEEAEETLDEHTMTFPSLDKLVIRNCPKLITLPEAQNLNVLEILRRGRKQIGLHVANRYITSLSTLKLSLVDGEVSDSLIELVDHMKWSRKWSHGSPPLRVLHLNGGCDFLFWQSSELPPLWNCFVQLEEIKIKKCRALVHWPENVFQRLVSLRKIWISKCYALTGPRQQERSCALPPRLESLVLDHCDSLIEIPTPLPASLKELDIRCCDRLKYVVLRKDGRYGVGIPSSSTTTVPNLSTSTTALSIEFSFCNLRSLSVQLDCIKTIAILYCPIIESVGGDFTSLENFVLEDCESLKSIPDEPQAAYSSLRYLRIKDCPRLEVLPPCLKQRLNDIVETTVDACYTETSPSKSWTWKRVMGRHCSTGDS